MRVYRTMIGRATKIYGMRGRATREYGIMRWKGLRVYGTMRGRATRVCDT